VQCLLGFSVLKCDVLEPVSSTTDSDNRFLASTPARTFSKKGRIMETSKHKAGGGYPDHLKVNDDGMSTV
jgi:hypothetical protein